jgi:hypothetical protein
MKHSRLLTVLGNKVEGRRFMVIMGMVIGLELPRTTNHQCKAFRWWSKQSGSRGGSRQGLVLSS